MIVSSLLILFAAAVLLVIGVASGDDDLLVTSIAASLAAAVALYTGAAARARRRAARRRARPEEETRELARLPIGEAPTTELPVVRGRVFEPTDYVVDREPEIRFETPPGRPPAGGRHQAADDPLGEPAEQRMSSVEAAALRRLDAYVAVVDGRPRFHHSGCVHLVGRDPEPLPVAEALDLGFTPCALCEPATRLLPAPVAGR